MTIYVVLLLTILILYIPLFDVKFKRYKRTFIILSFSCMILVLGLRGRSVGEDTSAYLSMFRVVQNTSWNQLMKGGLSFSWTQWGEDVEILFAILFKVISVFTDEPQYAIFITAMISYALFAHFIYKNCNDHVLFSTLIVLCNGVFMSSFNSCRQILALAIAINGYTLLREKKYIKVAEVFLISFLVHFSSVILLPLFLVSLLKNRRKIITVSAIVAVVMAVSVPFLSTIVNRFFPVYSVYLEIAKWNVSLGGTIFLWIAEIIVCIMLYTKGVENEFEFLGVLGVIFSIAFGVASLRTSVFSRVSVYFSFFNIILFPIAGDRIQSKSIRYLYRILIFTLIFLQYLSAASTPSREYFFFWQ